MEEQKETVVQEVARKADAEVEAEKQRELAAEREEHARRTAGGSAKDE